jgi:hypothetical protein
MRFGKKGKVIEYWYSKYTNQIKPWLTIANLPIPTNAKPDYEVTSS